MGNTEIRRAVRAMTAMLQNGEWAEHVSKDRDAMALESAITELHNELHATHPLAAAVLQQEAGEPVADWTKLLDALAPTRTLYGREGSAFDAGFRNAIAAVRAITTTQVPPPQARVPLTEERIKTIDYEMWRTSLIDTTKWERRMAFARAIERAHLIGLETKGDGNG